MKRLLLATILAADDPSRMITREEVTAVVSLSRPQSRRPIPSESEVRDPFVDLVASTRQKQVDRSVDVHAIFKGNVPGDIFILSVAFEIQRPAGWCTS